MPSPLVVEAVAHFDSLLGRDFDPKQWWQGYTEELRRHRVVGETAQPQALRPFMIDEASYQALLRSLSPVVQGFARAADILAADEPLRRKLGLPEYLEPLLEIDRAHGKHSTIARLDGMPSSGGALSVIEYNSEPQTAAFQYEVERAFDKLPIRAAFAQRYRVRTVDLYQRLFAALEAHGRARGTGLPTVAVLDKRLWLSRYGLLTFRPLMYASARGCRVLYVDPEELEYGPGGLCAEGGTVIDMVAFVDWSLLINDRSRLSQVVRAIAAGAVGVLNGLSRGLLASYKHVFELLSDPQHRGMFASEIATALTRHIPWTRIVRERKTEFRGTTVDLLPFVSARRALFVLKPAGGGGGFNVTVGHAVTDDVWNGALRRARHQPLVVQEYVAPERQRYPVVDEQGRIDDVELGCEFTPYVWNAQELDGALCRLSSGPVISAERQSGMVAATWIIDR
jgi:hypothetical protein